LNFFSLFKRKLLYLIKNKINIDTDGVSKKTLDELFYYYGSDKANFFKNKNTDGHGFSDFYTQFLNEIRFKDIKILEIGSYAGASACALVKYFPNSKVYCFDINISKFEYRSKNIEVFGLNIKDRKKVEETVEQIKINKKKPFFDIIIDDGSHNLSDILFAIKILFKHLKSKGFYIIEDYKFPNYYTYNKDIDDILIDQMLNNLKNKKIFSSNIINFDDQKFLHKEIKKIDTHKGNLEFSDICFIKKE